MKLDDFFFKMPRLQTDPIIDDTTLRDGAQMPGIAIKPLDAAKIAQLLCDIGAERLELFHYQEPDKQAAKLILDLKLPCQIAGWCRCLKDDIDSAIDMGFEEVGISHPVSYLHLRSKWRNKTDEELMANAVDVVEYAAKTHGLRTFIHGEDGTRADWNFEKKFVNAMADAGAKCYRVCDTVGIGLPEADAPLPIGIPAKIKALKKETRIEALEIHMHDDFGNAVANTLAAVRAASGLWDKIYINTTYLGIGERAGNAETEKILLNLYLHYGVKKYEGKTQKFKQIADFISQATGFVVPSNKAIVGEYGFTHESGIHTYGVLSNPWTYEPYPPELVGNTRHLTIGKQSGKGIIKHKIIEVTGNYPNNETLAAVVREVKAIYANGKRESLKEEEFKKILQNLSLLPRSENRESAAAADLRMDIPA
ncbi:MAG: isopropylmalate synthase [Candidatus Bathyarchaeota archaeon]|nr:isopropylmalate synthase [Candidatus Bathyarchaeota archaeon]